MRPPTASETRPLAHGGPLGSRVQRGLRSATLEPLRVAAQDADFHRLWPSRQSAMAIMELVGAAGEAAAGEAEGAPPAMAGGIVV